MKIIFIGSSTCIPDAKKETASFVINGEHLVDTGWNAVLKMREYGIEPLSIKSLIITHFHQDHYIGLPQLLFYMGLKKRTEELHIIGHKEHLMQVVNSAFDLLQISRFPELEFCYKLFPLTPGQTFEEGELNFSTCAAKHVSGSGAEESALAYKVIENTTSKSFVFTGDTSFHPPIAEFAKGLPLLIHDAAHTSPKDGAKIAKMANVGRLFLIHYSQERAESVLKEAKEVFSNSFPAREGETIEL